MRHIGILNKEWSQIFQSTHPLRDATVNRFASFNNFINISIHAPLTGCDDFCDTTKKMMAISIHAPLTGCDRCDYVMKYVEKDFNPRTPYGMRRRKGWAVEKCINFNPRTPYGMRRCTRWSIVKRNKNFNPRTPYGMRRQRVFKEASKAEFQSTHPLRDATLEFSNCLLKF